MTELEALQQASQQRMMRLGQQGTPLPIDGTFYLRRLLEHLVGAMATAHIQLDYERWLSTVLDDFESQIARTKLVAGPMMPPMGRNGHR